MRSLIGEMVTLFTAGFVAGFLAALVVPQPDEPIKPPTAARIRPTEPSFRLAA